MEIVYTAEPTLAKFHKSDAFFRCVRGPVRSGKSTGMTEEIVMRASRQKPGPGSIRRSRWAVVRNTYRELEDTTLATWKMWVPESHFGAVNQRTMTHTIQFNDLYMEVMFRALDRPDDVRKLLSLELTGGWINEAKDVPKAIVDVLGDRVEQYPPKKDEGCTWGGVFMDTNSPDEDHWWFELEAEPPKQILSSGKEVRWDFFIQPGALMEVNGRFLPNPKAENIRNLNGGHDYYIKRMMGKKPSYIRVYYCNQFGYAEDGKRVHPEYSDAVHCAPSSLVPSKDDQVIIGMDFGLTPAAAFFSRRANGQWWLFKELAATNIGIKRFAEMELLPYLLSELDGYNIEIYGDPYGNTGSQNDKQTPQDILNTVLEIVGLQCDLPDVSDGPNIRREALAAPLSRMIEGEPGLLIDPSCRVIRKGLASKYVYRRVQVAGDERFHDKPDKNWFSHICEAAQHAMVGAGEGARLLGQEGGRIILPKRTKRGWMAA